jgi:hypothetical protein
MERRLGHPCGLVRVPAVKATTTGDFSVDRVPSRECHYELSKSTVRHSTFLDPALHGMLRELATDNRTSTGNCRPLQHTSTRSNMKENHPNFLSRTSILMLDEMKRLKLLAAARNKTNKTRRVPCTIQKRQCCTLLLLYMCGCRGSNNGFICPFFNCIWCVHLIDCSLLV